MIRYVLPLLLVFTTFPVLSWGESVSECYERVDRSLRVAQEKLQELSEKEARVISKSNRKKCGQDYCELDFFSQFEDPDPELESLRLKQNAQRRIIQTYQTRIQGCGSPR